MPKGPRFPSAHFPIAPPALVISCWGQLHTPGMHSQISAHLKQSQHHSGAAMGRMGWWQPGGTTGDGLLHHSTSQRRMQCYSPNARCLLEKGCGVIKNRSMKDYLHFKNS